MKSKTKNAEQVSGDTSQREKTTKSRTKGKAKTKAQNDSRGKISLILYACFTGMVVVLACLYQTVIKPSEPKISSVVNSATNGGWKFADAETSKMLETNLCSVDRKLADDVTPDDFEANYRFKKPLLLKFKRGSRDWTDPNLWEVGSLLKAYGNWEIGAGTSQNIVRRGGNGDETSSLRYFINVFMNQSATAKEPLYMFDREFYKDTDLPRSLRVPPYLRVDDSLDDSIFFLGGSRSGVTFHQHADAWNGVVYGRKRWFLYPLDKTPPGGVWPSYTILDWYNYVYGNLTDAEKPVECIQGPGEILYLPEGWYHGTLNLGDTIAVGLQKKEAQTKAEKLFYKVLSEVDHQLGRPGQDTSKQKKLKQDRVDIYKQLEEMLPGNTEVQMKLGEAYADMGKNDLGIQYLQKSIDTDKYFLVAKMNLVRVLVKLKRSAGAESMLKDIIAMNPNFYEAYGSYGDLLYNQQRFTEAAKLYKQGATLMPELRVFWYRLKDAQEAAGDDVGVEETKRTIRYLDENEKR